MRYRSLRSRSRGADLLGWWPALRRWWDDRWLGPWVLLAALLSLGCYDYRTEYALGVVEAKIYRPPEPYTCTDIDGEGNYHTKTCWTSSEHLIEVWCIECQQVLTKDSWYTYNRVRVKDTMRLELTVVYASDTSQVVKGRWIQRIFPRALEGQE